MFLKFWLEANSENGMGKIFLGGKCIVISHDHPEEDYIEIFIKNRGNEQTIMFNFVSDEVFNLDKVAWKYIGDVRVGGRSLLAIPLTNMLDWKDCIICKYFPQIKVDSHDQEVQNSFLYNNTDYSCVFHKYGFVFQPDKRNRKYSVFVGYVQDQKICNVSVVF